MFLNYNNNWHIDPLGRPTITAGNDHCFQFSSYRSSVRPTFQKLTKQSENNVRYWRDCRSGRVDHWWHLSCDILVFLSIKSIPLYEKFLYQKLTKLEVSSLQVFRIFAKYFNAYNNDRLLAVAWWLIFNSHRLLLYFFNYSEKVGKVLFFWAYFTPQWMLCSCTSRKRRASIVKRPRWSLAVWTSGFSWAPWCNWKAASARPLNDPGRVQSNSCL